VHTLHSDSSEWAKSLRVDIELQVIATELQIIITVIIKQQLVEVLSIKPCHSLLELQKLAG